MNIKNEIARISKTLSSFDSNPIRSKPDYGTGTDIMHQLADHAGIDLDKEQENENDRKLS